MATKATSNKSNKQAPAPTTCIYCGKPLKAGNAGNCGALCAKNAKAGFTTQKRAMLKQALSYAQAPASYMLVSALHKVCVSNYMPIARMVRALGNDGVTSPPASPYTCPLYINNARYVPAILATKQGINALLTGNYSALPAPALWQVNFYNYVLNVQKAILAGKPLPQKPAPFVMPAPAKASPPAPQA